MDILSDVRFAYRVLVRRPAVPALVAGLFALSIGLASGVWALIDAALLRPLPYRDAGQLAVVMETHAERGMMSVPPANFFDWADHVDSLQDASGLGSLEASLVGGGDPVRVIGTKVTERFFHLMGVAPALGRWLDAADYHSDGRVVVIAEPLWARHFGGDPGIIGRSIAVDGAMHVVVGVMPRGFKTIGASEIWAPWIMSPAERSERRFHQMGVMARVRPGHSVADAQRELGLIYRRLQADHPDTTSGWTARVLPLRQLMLGDTRAALVVLGAAVAVLIVVASINVAALLLAWLPTRRQEFQIRMALGASASRVVRQLLLEALSWGVVGMAGGVALAAAFVRVFQAVGISPALEFDFEPAIDARVIGATTLLLVVNVGVTALVPGIVSVRRARDLVPRGTRATRAIGQRLAIVAQVALSLVLLCIVAQLLVGLEQLTSGARPAPRPAFAIDVTLPEGRYREERRQADFFERLLSALGARAEIAASAAASYLPPARIYGNIRFTIEGRATPADAQTTLASAISPGAFDLLGISLRRGRRIDSTDAAGAPRVGVISAALARRYWPNGEPIGQRITIFDDTAPITIVGVVDDVRQPLSPDARAESVLYLSYRQVPWYFMSIVVAPARDIGAALTAVRQEVSRLDPALAAGAARPLDEIRSEWLLQPRQRARVVSVFGFSALLLTLVGLYARVAYAAVSRTRELAIRQALGARPTDVVRILAGEALWVVLAGSAIGALCLPAASSAIPTLVAGVPPAGIRVTIATAVAVGMAAAVSVLWPARRIGRVDPAILLRTE